MSNDRTHLRHVFHVFVIGISLALAGNLAHATETRNKLASNKLAANALSSTRLEADLETPDFLSTEDGREVYSYIIGCALPDSMTIEITVPGVVNSPPGTPYTCVNEVCTLQGSPGLAQHWIDRRLDPKGQRWVTACLLARVNFHEEAEAISLRGLAPELTVSTDEAEEGTYGDCHAGEGDGHWPSLRTYREIITTYVSAD